MAENATDNNQRNKQFLEVVFEDLEKKYKTPDPEAISLGTVKFERFLYAVVLPFGGLLSFFIGILTLRKLEPGLANLLTSISFAAAVVIFSWLLYRRSYSEQGARIFIGAGLISLSASLLSLQPDILSFILTVVGIYAVVGFVIYFECSDKSLTLFFLLFPFIMLVLRQYDLIERLIVEGVVLIPLFIVFYKKQVRSAQIGVMFCALLIAIVEIAAQEFGTTALKLLLLGFIAVGIAYEMRMSGMSSQSNFRQFTGLTPLVLLIFIFLKTIHWKDDYMHGWIWAIAVACYQSIRIYTEKMQLPSRVVWIIFPFFYAVLMSSEQISWYTASAIFLILSPLLHLTGTRINNKFLSDSAVFLLGVTALNTYMSSERTYSMVSIIIGLLTAWSMVLVSQRQQFKPALAWWEGFLITDHVERLKNFFLMIIGPFLRIPIFSFVFAVSRAAFVWLKYFKGDNHAFKMNDLLFLSAHLFGVLMIVQQVFLYLNATSATAARRGLILATIWILWGFWLVVTGSRNKTVYHRLIGISFIIVPVIAEIRHWNVTNTILHSGLVILTGSALWLSVLIARSHKLMDATEQVEATFQVDKAGGQPS